MKNKNASFTSPSFKTAFINNTQRTRIYNKEEKGAGEAGKVLFLIILMELKNTIDLVGQIWYN